MRTRALIIVLACATAVPLVLVSVYRAHREQHRALDHARHAALLVARVEAAQQADRLNRMKDLLAGSPNLRLASLYGNTLAQPFQQTERMKGAVVSLLDLNGTLIARVPDVPQYRGRLLPGLRAAKDSHGAAREGFVEYAGLDGVARLGAYARIPGDEWPLQVVVGIPRADVEGPAHEALLRELLLLAVVLAAALGTVVVASQRLVIAPLARLTKAAERYSRGDFSARSGVDHGLAEIGTLARSFDRLAQQERRKTRALKALSEANRTLLRERREEDLLSAMCRVVESAGYRAAFVTRTGEEERARESMARPGSVASFPLCVADEVIGTFTVIAEEEDAFDKDEVELLGKMAGDLSFRIDAIRASDARRQEEAAARRALTHDPLVDLPNRPTFIQMVMAAIGAARRGGSPVAVLAIHVGRLQEIFDSFGYEAYRSVIKEIASRLAKVPACHDASARLPMEDFGVLVSSKDINVLGVIADRVLEEFRRPFPVGQVRLDVRAAVGVSFFPEHGDDGESLIRHASLVAREAFRKDGTFEVYQGAGDREKPQRLALAAELRKAIDQDELELHFQPKVRLADGATVGYEALARWTHASRGPLPPADFIPLAEQMGMIGPMTNSIIRMAVRQLHGWRTRASRLPIALNLSARNLYDPILVTSVARWLKSYDVPGELLHFEITEGALVEEPDSARETLNRLRAMGALIYIDDFGTGYSSLSYLATLPVNSLKIDRSFIRQMAVSHHAYAVVSSIVSLAHNLDLRVVAEGVETADQLDALKRLGCDEAQGYLFGRPLPAQDV